MNFNLFDFSKVHLEDFMFWLKSLENPSDEIKNFKQSLYTTEYTLLTVLQNQEQWNEYEIAVLAKNLMAIESITNFSPNCIVVKIVNAQPSKENILKELSEGNTDVFSFDSTVKIMDEYEIASNPDSYRFSLGVLLYSFASGKSVLPSRFRGIRKYNLGSSLERFFTKEAYDDDFRQLIVELVDNTIDIKFIPDRLDSIINKFKDDKPYSISTKLATSIDQDKYCESIKISVGQLIFDPLEHFHFAIGRSKEPDSSKQIDTILSFIEEAARESDILILPELALPRKYIQPIKRKLHSLEKDLMLICGITYEKFNSKIMLNQGLLLDRNNEIIFDKLQASPTDETKELKTFGMKLRPTSKINIYEHEKFGKFSILICYDFLSLPIQDLLYKEIDTLFILAFNSDISGFEFTAEAFVRMSLMNVVIVNCGNYGGSLAISPLRDPHKRVRLVVKGNDINSINTVKIPIQSLHQYKNNRKLNTTNFLCKTDCVDDKCQIRFIEYPAHFTVKKP